MDFIKLIFVCLFFAQQTYASNCIVHHNGESGLDTIKEIYVVVDITEEENVYIIQAQKENKLYTILCTKEDILSKNTIIQTGREYVFKTTKYFEKDFIPRPELSCMVGIRDKKLLIPMCGFNVLIAYDIMELTSY